MSSAEMPEALRQLDERLASIGGCSDGHCVIVRPKGMHTNGGCRCWRDGMKMQRLSYAFRQFRADIALAAAARKSGDGTAPSEGPQSGGEAATPNPNNSISNPTETGE